MQKSRACVPVGPHIGCIEGMPPPPQRDEVERRFVSLLQGDESREEIDAWAWQWWMPEAPTIDDDLVAWALDLFAGVAERHGRGLPYPHPDDQIAEWLDDFRKRAARR